MQDRHQQGASARRTKGSQKTMDPALMRTEYMDRFLPPFSYKMIVRTIQKHPYHPLKGTSADAATLQTFYLAPKWIKNPPKRPHPSVQDRGQQKTSSASQNAEQQANKHQQPAGLSDSPKVYEEPFERTTSYRTDYVAHPVQPRTCIKKPVSQSCKDLISESTQAHEKPLSTTHADFVAHKCQRTKPILPTTKNYEKSTQPFQSTTTMKEDFRAWNVERRRPIIPKQELDWLKPYPPRTHENSKNVQTGSSPCPELRETVMRNIAYSPQSPAEKEIISGFECIWDGIEESRTFWRTCVSRGVSRPSRDVCDESCEKEQTITCTVSRKANEPPKTGLKKKRGSAAPAREVSALNTNKSQK